MKMKRTAFVVGPLDTAVYGIECSVSGFKMGYDIAVLSQHVSA
jgi:hypothetical protein